MSAAEIEPLGDCALLVRLGTGIDIELSARAHALAKALRAADWPGIVDIVPAYASIAVRYDPRAWEDPASTLPPGEFLARRLQTLALAASVQNAENVADAEDRVVEIPVCYGGENGPDLSEVARTAGLEEAQVISRHAKGDYRVAMLGFAPGFPYLLGLDPALHVPRRANPRTRVPAGSVAIGGAQTGIYPRELPGGWQIIGRTPCVLFDAARNPPALLAPGLRVRFRAIGSDEFGRLHANG